MVDYQRVRVRHIDARLDDRRRDENVYLSHDHPAPDVGKSLLVHLPVRDRDPRLRNGVREPERDAVYVVDRVVQEEHLTSAPQLLLYRLGDDEIVVLHDEGLHR